MISVAGPAKPSFSISRDNTILIKWVQMIDLFIRIQENTISSSVPEANGR